MRRTGIDGGVVLDIRFAAGSVELVDRALRNARVGAAEEREHRALVARHRVNGLGAVRPPAQAERPAVEADDARIAESARRLQVRERAAEAEANGEDRPDLTAVLAAQVSHTRLEAGPGRSGTCTP